MPEGAPLCKVACRLAARIHNPANMGGQAAMAVLLQLRRQSDSFQTALLQLWQTEACHL